MARIGELSSRGPVKSQADLSVLYAMTSDDGSDFGHESYMSANLWIVGSNPGLNAHVLLPKVEKIQISSQTVPSLLI
jgi:hypothetical protein